MLKKNDIITLEITDIASDASGVGRYESIAIFVPFSAIGDVLKVKIVKVVSRCCFAIIEEIITPSVDRIDELACPHFKKCGGCSLRHINYTAEIAVKNNWVKENLKRIGKVEVEQLPPVASPQEHGYRNKAIYPVGTLNGKAIMGFFAKRTHRIIELSDCALHPEFFGEIVRDFSNWLNENSVSVYDELKHQGLVRALFIRHAEAAGEVMLAIIANGKKIPYIDLFIQDITAKFPNIKSIILNINNAKTNVVMGKKDIVLFGKETITDVLCGVEIDISPLSFYQVNRQGAEKLYNIAKDFAELTGDEILLDLYCGAGTIGLSLANYVKQIIGVEIVVPAIENAKKNAERANITNVRFICSDASEAAKLLKEEGVCPDVVILDPPRKGCDISLIKTIVSMAPKRVVMVSCDSATAARDVSIFSDLGYVAKKIQAVDMFARTGHCEVVIQMTLA